MIVSNTNRWIMLEPLATVDSVSPPPPPSSSYTSYPYSNFNPSMSIVVVMLFFAFFFMAYLSLYFRQCYENSSEPSDLRFTASTIRRPKRVLEQSVSNSFPIFCYGEIKEQRIGREVLECAVCLGEFGKEDSVKLMPKCCHVFHRECIDTWLACHVTCPVCRADLDQISGEGLIERAEQINMSRLEIISGNESIWEQVGNQVHQC